MKTLEENGKKVCVDFRDFTPGVPITENIVEAIVESKVTILVLTPSFIESEWCKYESRHALGGLWRRVKVGRPLRHISAF